MNPLLQRITVDPHGCFGPQLTTEDIRAAIAYGAEKS